MAIGRDHHEFHANIPRKDYSREFKNGFYNGRTLAEHNPELITQLISDKGGNKDYKKGLESARKEYQIKGIHQKMSHEQQTKVNVLKADDNYKKGFNIGYKLAQGYGKVLTHAQKSSEKYAAFALGLQLGVKQYELDITAAKEKSAIPVPKWLKDDPYKPNNGHGIEKSKDKGIEPNLPEP
jgi:hypothetical protein